MEMLRIMLERLGNKVNILCKVFRAQARASLTRSTEMMYCIYERCEKDIMGMMLDTREVVGE